MRTITIRHTNGNPAIGQGPDDRTAGALLEDFVRVCALPEVFPIYVQYMKAMAIENGGDPSAMDGMRPENLIGTADSLHLGHCAECYRSHIAEMQ